MLVDGDSYKTIDVADKIIDQFEDDLKQLLGDNPLTRLDSLIEKMHQEREDILAEQAEQQEGDLFYVDFDPDFENEICETKCDDCNCDNDVTDIIDETDEWADGELNIYRLEDGRMMVEVPGFGQDDLDITLDGDIATFHFLNDDEDGMIFRVKLPKDTTDLNVSVSKGRCMFWCEVPPSSVNINVGL